MTSDQRKFEQSCGPLRLLSRKMLRPPRNASISSIWPTSGGRWRPVQKFTKFLRETAHRSAVNEWLSSAVRPRS